MSDDPTIDAPGGDRMFMEDASGDVMTVVPVEAVDGLTEPGDQGDRPDIPPTLPLLPIRETVAFPATVMPLNVGREKSKRVLDLALTGNRLIGVVAQRKAGTEDPGLDDLYRVGTACRILKMFKLPDGTDTIVVHGICRVGIENLVTETPYLAATVHAEPDVVEASTEIGALMHTVRQAADRILELSPNIPEDARVVLRSIRTPGALADFLAANLSLGLVHKQELLETFDVALRLRKVNAALAAQLEVLELSNTIQNQVRGQMDKAQRDYYLHEQLKAIQHELGAGDARASEIERIKAKVAEAKMPEAAQQQADREIERLQSIPQASPEYSVTLDYIEWLASLPWQVSTPDLHDIKLAREVLEADHYDLEKIKKRILEFLAVRQLKPDGKGPILCFAGPPGVGKTSLGRSIAKALGRKFIRMSLGGIRDEADIRGHRRTYIGALPGRVIQEIKKAGANNPVFMLDEVDKIGQDFRGDPASALLEVLDPEQNFSFSDHYLDVPFDLSRVLFIATANYLEEIPHALRDRMEVIQLSGYTAMEKLHIAQKYLVPRQLEQHGLKPAHLRFSEEVLDKIIRFYTREAGVRNLERQIASVCRGRAAAIVENEHRSARITTKDLHEDLGPPIFESEVASRVAVPGVVTGLAFTQAGGEILFVEATRMPGSSALQLTGQIGNVMRESAQTAYSYIRSHASTWKLDAKALNQFDYHIHVPAGAVPKDGPSAGVAMIVSLLSLLTDRMVDPRTGMTGEITLRGSVLPVGGIKEKVLAAHRAGLRRVILPRRNERDLEDVPAEVRKEIEFVFVKSIDTLLGAIFPKAVGAVSDRESQRKRERPEPVRPPGNGAGGRLIRKAVARPAVGRRAAAR